MARIAVVLFNLGGPDRLEAVLPFLINLFSDPAILRLPQPFRWLLAQTIARRRAPVAREIYAQIGGASPIVEGTRAQAAALETEIADQGTARVFIAMRYWHPRAAEIIESVRAFAPDRIVLLPLYPQYSTTTTASSVAEWRALAGAMAPEVVIGCYPTKRWFAEAHAAAVAPLLAEAAQSGTLVVLFSAHGLPKRIAATGDPYPGHTRLTCEAIAEVLGLAPADWRLCYQSRVGRLEWTGPSIDDEIRAAGTEGRPVVVVPIAFTSEHSETLVELDIEYRALADRAGVPAYFRAPTPAADPGFIGGLGKLVRRALNDDLIPCPADPGRSCPTICCTVETV